MTLALLSGERGKRSWDLGILGRAQKLEERRGEPVGIFREWPVEKSEEPPPLGEGKPHGDGRQLIAGCLRRGRRGRLARLALGQGMEPVAQLLKGGTRQRDSFAKGVANDALLVGGG